MPTIRMLREARGWTQAELAKKIGAHVNTIARWEQGAIPPGTRSLHLLAVIFGVTVDDLIATDPVEAKPRGRPRRKATP